MDPLTEDFSRPEEMRMLTPEDVSEQNNDTSDEVESLQNSLREAVHDETIQPKMQCLMMDSSFSMVTMQGEDSGIEWETTPSLCTTPWTSEAGSPPVDLSTAAATGPAPAAGKIIFVMDEELISRQKKTKERGHGSKAKGAIQQDVVLGSSDNISGRPELVSFSQPNVKLDTEELEEELTDPSADKEQKLFRLVSEGSEILNIIVPPKIATVDEEESKEMEDNLSFLEASPVVKANEEIQEQQFELQNDVQPVPPEVANTVVPSTMDPPGAPVPKALIREAPSNVDYFEAFALIDAEAPGSPAVTEHGQGKAAEAITTLESEISGPTKVPSATIAGAVDDDNADNISLIEMASELLDEVFYGATNNIKTTERTDVIRTVPSRLSLKTSGSSLFGSQEEILTPIYLPEGPHKIIDPILLEEPKAMAFFYTDLYEEATGSRKKEEDTESLSSEKSFHSRHSDREARGYLEKFVLIDETPVVEVQQSDKVKHSDDSPRVMTEDLYEIDNFVSKPEKLPDSADEVTDFFRSSASSSPCVLEHLTEEEEDQIATKPKAKTNKSVVIVAEKVPECTTESEFTIDEPDWECAFDDPISLDKEENVVQTHPQPVQQPVEIQLPIVPPRKKSSSQKACLDLAPLTPVDAQEDEKPGGKEQCEEEKETASPAETADEGDEEETMNTFAIISPDTAASGETETPTNDEEATSENEITVSELASYDDNLKDNTTINEKTKTEQKAPEEADTESPASTNVEPKAESSTEPVKKGQCIIL